MNKLVSIFGIVAVVLTLALAGLKFFGIIAIPWILVFAPLLLEVILVVINVLLSLLMSGSFLVAAIIIVALAFGIYYFVNMSHQQVNFNPSANKIEQKFMNQ